jgi:hypothetical protein
MAREKPLSLERAKRAEKPKRGGWLCHAERRSRGASLGHSLVGDGGVGKVAPRFVDVR